jgi:hypothetical protein
MDLLPIIQPINKQSSINVKELRLIRYFVTKNKTDNPIICYDIKVILSEYKPGKFRLNFEIEQEGFDKSYEEYYFEGILKINKWFNPQTGVEVKIKFITYPTNVETFMFNRFNYEDANKLHDLLLYNVIY